MPRRRMNQGDFPPQVLELLSLIDKAIEQNIPLPQDEIRISLLSHNFQPIIEYIRQRVDLS